MDTDRFGRSDGRIALYLTADEALVIDAFLARGREAGYDYSIEDQAELRVLWDIAAILEPQLTVVVNNPDYPRDLALARARVRDGGE